MHVIEGTEGPVKRHKCCALVASFVVHHFYCSHSEAGIIYPRKLGLHTVFVGVYARLKEASKWSYITVTYCLAPVLDWSWGGNPGRIQGLETGKKKRQKLK